MVLSLTTLLVVALLLALAPALAAPAASEDDVTVHFVVDTSGSMQGTPLQEAKQALTTGIDALPDSFSAGLREFSGPCGQGGNLLVEVDRDNRGALYNGVEGLQAGGLTPSPEALRAAALDLPDSGNRSIVFISDGESTCGDPCPVAAEIAEEQGVNFRVHTVGFRAPEAAESELACIANVTGGTYFEASNEDELTDAIRGVISGPRSCPRVQVIAARGSGQDWDGSTLEEPLNTFVNHLRFRLENEDADTWATEDAIDVVSLDYPAVDAQKAVDAFVNLARNPGQDPIDGNEYIESLNQGVQALGAELDSLTNAGCSETQVVLAGFSQGAQVVADSLSVFSLERRMPDQIASVRLFGEPRFNPRDPAAIPGTLRRGGIFGMRGELEFGPDVVESWCVPGDPICDNGTFISVNALRSRIDSALNKEGRHSSYHTASVQRQVPAPAAATSTCSAILGRSCTTLRFGDGLGPGFDNPATFRGQVPWQTNPPRP